MVVVEIVVVEIVVVKMSKDEVHLYQLYNLLLVGEPLEGALEEEALELLLLFFSSELLQLPFSSELLLLLICFSSVVHLYLFYEIPQHIYHYIMLYHMQDTTL